MSFGAARVELYELLELALGLVQATIVEEQSSQVQARWHEAGIDGERRPVVIRGGVALAAPFGEHAERVVRLRDLFVDAARAREQLGCAIEVAPLELDQTEVREGLYEARVVLE